MDNFSDIKIRNLAAILFIVFFVSSLTFSFLTNGKNIGDASSFLLSKLLSGDKKGALSKPANAAPVICRADANLDGQVDQTDYTLWYNNYGRICSFPTRCEGADTNYDNIVDQQDYTTWYNSYGMECLIPSFVYVYDNTAKTFVSATGLVKYPSSTNTTIFITPNNAGLGGLLWPLAIAANTRAIVEMPPRTSLYDELWFQTSPELKAPFTHTFYYDGIDVTLVPPAPYANITNWLWAPGSGNYWFFWRTDSWHNYLYLKPGTKFRMELAPNVYNPPYFYSELYDSNIGSLVANIVKDQTYVKVTCYHNNLQVPCTWSVYTTPDDMLLKSKWVDLTEEYFYIPAGDYRVSASWSTFTQNKIIPFTPNTHHNIRFDF